MAGSWGSSSSLSLLVRRSQDRARAEDDGPILTALFDEVRTSYGTERCGFPYIAIVRESFLDGPRVVICGKGGGSWGLKYAGIEGIGPHTTLADVSERDWYPEVLKVHHAFIENGAKRYLSGQKDGYVSGAWLRSLYMVMVHALLGREIGSINSNPY